MTSHVYKGLFTDWANVQKLTKFGHIQPDFMYVSAKLTKKGLICEYIGAYDNNLHLSTGIARTGKDLHYIFEDLDMFFLAELIERARQSQNKSQLKWLRAIESMGFNEG